LIFTGEGGKLENLEKNPCGMGENNIRNKLSSHMTSTDTGIKPGPQWCKAGTLTALPSMPHNSNSIICISNVDFET